MVKYFQSYRQLKISFYGRKSRVTLITGSTNRSTCNVYFKFHKVCSKCLNYSWNLVYNWQLRKALPSSFGFSFYLCLLSLFSSTFTKIFPVNALICDTLAAPSSDVTYQELLQILFINSTFQGLYNPEIWQIRSQSRQKCSFYRDRPHFSKYIGNLSGGLKDLI